MRWRQTMGVPVFMEFSPLTKRVIMAGGVLVTIVTFLVALTHLRTTILSGVRAYVGGEALWSKGQKDAVHYLARYAENRDEEDFRRYRQAIAVPLGDRQARLELEKSHPDYGVVRAGFLQGRLHPDDIANMSWLFRRFRHVGHMEQAIEVWTRGDLEIERLVAVGERLRHAVTSGRADASYVRVALTRIHVLNERLTRLEDAFSSALGEGNRWAERVLAQLTYVMTALILAWGVTVAWLVLRQMHASELAVQRADQFKASFLASMSHELRNPLNVVIGYHEMLGDEEFGPLTPEQRGLLSRADASARELLVVVSNTLSISRIEADRALDVEEINLLTLLHDLESETRAKARRSDVEIEVDLPADAPTLVTDRVKLRMVLNNLVSNAIKYTARGKVAIGARWHRSGVMFSVADTGVGIPPEAHDVIFAPFHRLNQGNGREHDGAGLGLYIVRRLIAALDGKVSVESEVGRGSTFHVWVPTQQRSER